MTVRLVSRRMRPSDCRARCSKGEQAGGERAKLVVCGQISLARRVVNESRRDETRRDEEMRVVVLADGGAIGGRGGALVQRPDLRASFWTGGAQGLVVALRQAVFLI